MKITDLQEMIKFRENATAYLHISNIKLINDIAGGDCSKESFSETAERIISRYKNKKISNKNLTKCIMIMCSENTLLKVESHRMDGYGNILEYRGGSYHFLQKGGKKEFDRLNHYISA